MTYIILFTNKICQNSNMRKTHFANSDKTAKNMKKTPGRSVFFRAFYFGFILCFLGVIPSKEQSYLSMLQHG